MSPIGGLWSGDFRVQTDEKLLANQPDIELVDKEQKTAVVWQCRWTATSERRSMRSTRG